MTAAPRPAPPVATDERADPRTDAPGADPSADGRDPERVVREVRESMGERPSVDDLREAVTASEREVGAEATRDRLRSGDLTAGDGTPLLEGLSRGERRDLAAEYKADVLERGAAPDVALDADAQRLAGQTASVRDHLAAVYQEPDRALDTLHGLDAEGRADFAAGRTDLGERRTDALAAEPRRDGLLAHLDVRDQFPEPAAQVDAAREQGRTRDLAREFEPNSGVGGVDPTRGLVEKRDASFEGKTIDQLAYQMSVPQQI